MKPAPGAGHGRVSLPWSGRDRAGAPLRLRTATRRDAARYLVHARELLVETPFMLQSLDDRRLSVGEQKDVFDEYEARDNCVCILALRPGRPGRQRVIGSVTVVGGHLRRTRQRAELTMGVSQRAWGRGIGGLLLAAALTWAEANPIIERVSLQVLSSNLVALSLYRSRGFVDEGLMRRFAKWQGRYDDLVGMSLSVGDRDVG